MNFCKPTGQKDARIAIIAEAPGRDEILEGIGLVGPSGKLTWKAFGRYGIRRSDCYVTNVIKTSAPQFPLENMLQTDLDFWRDYLIAELQDSDCNVYCLMGATALWAMTGETKITSWRGSVMSDIQGRKCFAIRHPAALFRTMEEFPAFLHDIQRVVEESYYPQIIEQPKDFIIKPTFDQAMNYIEQCRCAGELAFDIETDIISKVPICVGLSYDPDSAICIPLGGRVYWKPLEYVEIIKACNDLLSDSHILKIGQNVNFDIVGLKPMGITVKPPYDDTLLIHHSIDPLEQHSLARQASLFTRLPYWKDWDSEPEEGYKSARLRDEQLYEYNCKDASATLELKRTYKLHYPERYDFYEQVSKPLQPHLIQMYFDGLCVDVVKQQKLAWQYYEEARLLNKAIETGLGVQKFNINSSKQVQHVLYDVLELPKQYKRVGRKITGTTVDDEALVNIYLESQNQYALLIREAKKKLKLASFLQPKSKDAQNKRKTWDGRIRSELRQNTQTGRLRAAKSAATAIGVNLQQFPDAIKATIIPAPGKIFLELDYQQAEARGIAWDGQDIDTINFFESARKESAGLDYKSDGDAFEFKSSGDYDIHWRNAEIILQQSRKCLTATDRQLAKPIGFGSWYGMQPRKIQREILENTTPPMFVDLDECTRRYESFKRNAPNCFDRQARIKEEVLRTGRQKSPTGFEVIYNSIIVDSDFKFNFGRRDHSEELRSAYSMIPQNVVAYLIGRAIVKTDSKLRRLNIGRVCLQVHDSMLLEVEDNPELLKWAFSIATRAMEEPITIHDREMVIPTDAKLGYTWQGKWKKIKTIEQLMFAYGELKHG